MTCRERLANWLSASGVKYDVTFHRTAYTAQDVAASENISGYEVAKVVMAVVDGKLAMLVLPAPHRVDLSTLTKALGAREARLAAEHEFANMFPDCEVGAMPPFGNLYGVPVYVDPILITHPRIVFNAGSHRETMAIAYADFQRLVQPKVIEFTSAAVFAEKA